MVSFLRGQRTILLMLWIALLAVKGGASSSHLLQVTEVETSAEVCPPCETFFRKLEKTGSAGKLAQTFTVQERGEPKSGTGVFYTWGAEALLRTCDYLQELYGEESEGFTPNSESLTPHYTHPSTHASAGGRNRTANDVCRSCFVFFPRCLA